MSRDIIFEKVAAQYIQNALNLSVRQYEREKSFNPILPEFDSYDQLEQLIATLFEKGTGLVGIQNGQVVAYIAGFKVENFFGNVAGVYCPIYGHGLSAECHRKTLVQLYSRDYEPIGMMRLSPNAETFISDHPSVMNIQMTYIYSPPAAALVGSQVPLWLLRQHKGSEER